MQVAAVGVGQTTELMERTLLYQMEAELSVRVCSRVSGLLF